MILAFSDLKLLLAPEVDVLIPILVATQAIRPCDLFAKKHVLS